MNKVEVDIESFFSTFNGLVENIPENIVVGIAPTFVGLLHATKNASPRAMIMAQNCSAKTNGAYTSQVSYQALLDIGINMILLGHSEVRQYLHETDEIINEKVNTLLNNDMKPVLCIGETLEQFEQEKTNEILKNQLEKDLLNIDKSKLSNLIIAYEPIWAIGTGKTATNEIIEKTFMFLKQTLIQLLGDESKNIALLYGGSANEKNAKDILSIKNVDGVLVGGASLDPNKFIQIIKSC